MNAPPRQRSVETSSGEREPEAWSRLGSLAELAVVFAAFHSALWLGAGQPAATGEQAWIRALGVVVATGAAAYAMLVAPRLHGDGWHGLGLAEPGELRAIWPGLTPATRVVALALVVALPIAVLWFGWDYLLIRLGIRRTWPDLYLTLLVSPWRQAAQLGGVAVMGSLFATVLIRWSNLPDALRAFAWPTAIMLVAIVGVAAFDLTDGRDWMGSGTRPAMGRSRPVLDRISVYLPWAVLQQWVLLGYFNTRVRKVIPPEGAMGLSGRPLAAALTGIVFAAMHAPAASLVLFTLVSGTVWGWLFQRDNSRNLFVVTLAHALCAAALGALTGMSMMVGR